jgi:intergrase/recombinase
MKTLYRPIELEVPESVTDFIEGRVPKRIGAKHYMALRRQADRLYTKYAEYLNKSRSSLQS